MLSCYNLNMAQVLVILRGAPASGKSTISKALRNFDKKIVWFKTDNLKEFFLNPADDKALDEVFETCYAVLDNLLERGYSVIYEGIFKKPEYAQKAIDIGKERNIPITIYQLECSLETLKKRDKGRSGVTNGIRPPMEETVIESLLRKVEENPIEGAIKLNTEEKSLEDCIEIIGKNFE